MAPNSTDYRFLVSPPRRRGATLHRRVPSPPHPTPAAGSRTPGRHAGAVLDTRVPSGEGAAVVILVMKVPLMIDHPKATGDAMRRTLLRLPLLPCCADAVGWGGAGSCPAAGAAASAPSI
eukprot:gene399-biopygen7733